MNDTLPKLAHVAVKLTATVRKVEQVCESENGLVLSVAHGMIETSMPLRTFLRSGLTVLQKKSPNDREGRKSKGMLIRLTCTNANDLFKRGNKNLTIANLTRPCGVNNSTDDTINHIISTGDF